MTVKKVTSNDVARLAGVSQSTVSRIFTPGASVSPKTREKVLAAAQQLGYKPNAIARSLITQSTNIIGFVMANMTSPFYPYVLEKFTRRLQAMGKQVLLFTAEPNQDIDDILSTVLQYQVDALIITSTTLSSIMAEECAKNGTPVILFNRYVVGAKTSAVCCDNVAGGQRVADFLLDTGHQRLAYIAGNPNTSTNVDRQRGFFEGLQARGYSQRLIEQGSYSYESGYECAKRLLEQANPPDAIFCASDVIAQGALDAARFDLGLKIPDDLSIIGFDDTPGSSWPAYDLTTMRQPVNRMIEVTLDLLQERFETPNLDPVLKFLPGTLVERGSTRKRN